MVVDGEFTVKIKIPNMILPDGISWMEVKQRLLDEGDKRIKYLSSGYLQDPEGKIVSKDVTYKIKEN